MSRAGLTVVTGASGLIGSHLVRALAAEGRPVAACDTVGRGARPYLDRVPLADWIAADRLLDWLDAHAGEVGAVIHMGAISDTTEIRLDRLMASNYRLTLALWERACRHDWRFLYASSAATYGGGEEGFDDSPAWSDLMRLQPLNPYGWSKHVTDLAILGALAAGARGPSCWAGFKFFNVYGPHEEHKGAMRSLVRKIVPTIRRGERIQLFQSHRADCGHGQQRRDFIYVRDAIVPVLRALDRTVLGGIYNVGTGVARSFEDLARAAFAALGAVPRIDYVPMPEAIRDQYQYFTCAEVTRAREAGLHCAAWSLEAGVADYVAALGDQPEET